MCPGGNKPMSLTKLTDPPMGLPCPHRKLACPPIFMATTSSTRRPSSARGTELRRFPTPWKARFSMLALMPRRPGSPATSPNATLYNHIPFIRHRAHRPTLLPSFFSPAMPCRMLTTWAKVTQAVSPPPPPPPYDDDKLFSEEVFDEKYFEEEEEGSITNESKAEHPPRLLRDGTIGVPMQRPIRGGEPRTCFSSH
jgi:hypothetical protein